MAVSRYPRRRRAIRALVAAAACIAGTSLGAAGAGAATVAESVCPPPPAGYARCEAEILVNAATGARVLPADAAGASRTNPTTGAPALPADGGVSAPQTGSPAWLRWAYDLESLSATGPSSTDTVAIVDPYGYVDAETDLDTFRSTLDLPACTTADGCFEKVNQTGGTSSYPADPSGCDPASQGCTAGWITETALDLDTVSAICPTCHVLLVQANSAADSDLAAAETTAASFDPQQISNSWSWTDDNEYNGDFDQSSIAVVAATGDDGYGSFGVPAELPFVTAAGGTSLPTGDDARGFAETAWWGTASGCATGLSKPSWQTDTGCASRTVADLSADADINTGAMGYDTEVDDGWFAAGGTSVASPLIAAYYALVGGGAGDGGASWAYSHASALNDIITGADGTCPTSAAYLCTAEPGYDGPTGVGSVSGDVAAGPPQVGGSYAQDVTATSATLAGGVYANQYDTQVSWQYGTTASYGQQTSTSDAGSAPGATPVQASITDLTPGTEYHFRLVMQNSQGTSYGYDDTFSTIPPSTTVTATSASSSGPTSVTTVTTVTASQSTPTTTQTVTASTASPLVTSTTTTHTSAQAAIARLAVVVGASAQQRHGRRVRVLVRCNRACAGSLTLHADGKVIGKARITLGPTGLAKLVAVTLNKKGQRLVRAHRTLHAIVTVACNGHGFRSAILIV